MQFPKIISAIPQKNYCIYLHHEYGTKGTVSLEELTDTEVFSVWKDSVHFDDVKINPERNILYWNDEMEISSDGLYLKLRRISFQDLQNEMKHASVK